MYATVSERRYCFDEADFDNLLVRQKNKIWQLAIDGQFQQARECLNVVRELWEVPAINYAYKIREIEELIEREEELQC